MSESLPNAPVRGSKRRRFRNACDFCRQRKMRCNSSTTEDNVCSNCIASNVPCTHHAAETKKKQNATKLRVKQYLGPEKQPQSTSPCSCRCHLDDGGSYTPSSNPCIVTRILFDLASYARSMEDQPFVPPASPSPEPEIEPSNYSGLEIGAGYGNEAEPENDDEDDESSIHNSRTKFHGHSSTADLIKSAISMKKEYTGEGFEGKRGRPRFHRPVYWEVLPWQKLYHRDPPPLEFPPNDLLLSLVDLYFQNVNFITPFLHRPTFDRLIASNAHMHQYDFGALLLAVCAMGSRYSDDPRVFADDSNSELSIGWRYMGQVQIVRPSYTEPASLYDLQLYCVCSIFLRGTSLSEYCGPLIALGMRLAQERGVHRKGHNPGETKTEQELWRRTYWQLINIDIQASVFMGRPPAHMMEDHDLELPADCDDEYWEHPDPKQAFKQPPGRPCTMTAWILLLKLINIFAVAQRLVYPINGKRSQPSQEQEQIKQLDVALEKWLTSIPDYLHWDPKKPSSIFQDQSVSLFSLYAWVQMQIHRTFVRGKTSPHYSSLSLSSLARSTSAARACCQLLAVHQARGPIPLPHIQAVIFQSAIILMVHAWAAKRFSIASNYDDDIRDVARCSDALQYYENRWQLSGRMRDILQELLNKHSEQHRIQQPQPALRTNITQPVVDRAFTAIPHPKSSESSVPVQSEMYPVLQSHVGSVWPGSDTDYTSAFDTSLPAVNIQHPYSVPLPSSLMDTDMTQLTSEDLGFLNALGNIPGNQPLLGLDSGWSQWGAVEQNYGDQNYYQTWSNEPFGYMSEQT